MAVRLVGLGGSLRASSRSRAALAVALDGAAAAGATIELLDLRQLALPMFNPEHEADAPLAVRAMIETCYAADGMLWSSPMYNGSVSGSFKNAIDWLHLLGSRDPAYLHDKVVDSRESKDGDAIRRRRHLKEHVDFFEHRRMFVRRPAGPIAGIRVRETQQKSARFDILRKQHAHPSRIGRPARCERHPVFPG